MSLMRDDIHDFILYRQSLGRARLTLEGYQLQLRTFRRFCEGRKIRQTQDITPAIIKRFQTSLIKENLVKGTIANKVNALRLFLDWAYTQNKTLINLARHAIRPRLGSPIPPSPLTRDEMKALLNLIPAKGIVNLRDRAILELLYATGIRNAELRNLNVGDMDFKAQTLFIRGKGQKDRIVPVHDAALDMLANYLAARRSRPDRKEPLFIIHERDQKHRITRNNVDNIFRKITGRFNKRIYPHLIRHTFAIHMLQGGADLRYVQALLGHESPDTTSLYLHYTKDEQKLAYDHALYVFWLE